MSQDGSTNSEKKDQQFYESTITCERKITFIFHAIELNEIKNLILKQKDLNKDIACNVKPDHRYK